jgi:hypothetical protein
MSLQNTDFSAKNQATCGGRGRDFSQKNRFGSNLEVQV